MEVDDSGAVADRRVVTLRRAGRFAAQLEPAELKALEKAVAAAASAEVEMQAPSRPPYEIEDIESEQNSLSFHPEQKLPRPVTLLRNRLRKLHEDLADHPVAAVELEAGDSGDVIRVRVIGEAPCQVDWGSGEATYDLFGSNEALLTSGSVKFPVLAGRQELQPGWQEEAGLSVEFSADKTLQVRLPFSMKFEDGRWRDCQLTAVAGKGW